jgi:hypothetical protein
VTEKAIDPKRQGDAPSGSQKRFSAYAVLTNFLLSFELKIRKFWVSESIFCSKTHNKCKFHSCLLGREMVTFEWSKRLSILTSIFRSVEQCSSVSDRLFQSQDMDFSSLS